MACFKQLDSATVQRKCKRMTTPLQCFGAEFSDETWTSIFSSNIERRMTKLATVEFLNNNISLSNFDGSLCSVL